MSAQKPTMTAKLTASALSLFTESTSSETTASRARSASSALTSLPPSPKKARRDESETPGHFRSPVKAGALPTPSTTSNGSQVATTAPAMRKPARRMARASMHRSTPDPHDDGKEYLVAGMYYSEPVIASSSSTSPPSELKRPARSASMRPRKDELNWRKMQQPSSFPLPIYHGAIMLEEERDFKLSFDVLRDGQATSRDGKGVKMCRKAEAQYDAVEREKLESSQKPPPYRSIPKNLYVERKPEKSDHPAVCACELPDDPDMPGCREDCMNRLMQYICDKKTCPCGERCSNVPLRERQSIPEGKGGLKVVWTGDRGFGLKTMVPIMRGQFVMEYRGEIIGRDEAYKRVLTTYKGAKSYYFLDYDGHEVIDAGQKGNTSRFINHSCGPNVKVISWKMASMEEFQMGIFALYDIPAGTELTYDYGWQDFSAVRPNPNASPPPVEVDSDTPPADPARQPCYCGADVCSGFLGGKKKEPHKKDGYSDVVKKAAKKARQSSVPPLPLTPAGKVKTAVNAAVARMKEVVGAKKTAVKVGAAKPVSKIKAASKDKPSSAAAMTSFVRKVATPRTTYNSKIAMVVGKRALMSSGRGAQVSLVRTSSTRRRSPVKK